MTDFAAGLGDWDLTAVVSGYTASSLEDDHHLLFGNFVFPEYLFDDSAISNPQLELNDLYKPFYPSPDFDQFQCPFSSAEPESLLVVPDEEKPEPFPVPDVVTPAADRCSKAAVGTKYRTRKNQQKRVVMEVTGEELSSDMWAWRKYGQKPIKGSPHPRSYYRCSSSKGCPARKMMERSQLDPGTFIMTYTGEHNHSKPTRRNSLAGTTRQRFPSVPAPAGETCVKKKPKKGMTKITETAEEMDYTCGEPIVGDHYHHHHHPTMGMMGDDDSFMSALTQSNDLGFYQEHDDSSFW